MKQVRIGCSGWMYDDWRGRLYPEREPKRRWLELYAESSTPSRSTTPSTGSPASRWSRDGCAQTPDGFLFAVKASRYLTHIKRLQGIEEGIKRFYEPLAPLIEARRLGPILWQLPENFHRDDERLEGWLAAAARGHAHDRVPSRELVRRPRDGAPAGRGAWR